MTVRDWEPFGRRIDQLLTLDRHAEPVAQAAADQHAAAWRDAYDDYGITLHEETDVHTALVTIHALATLSHAYTHTGTVHPVVDHAVRRVCLQAETRLVLAAPRELMTRLARSHR